MQHKRFWFLLALVSVMFTAGVASAGGYRGSLVGSWELTATIDGQGQLSLATYGPGGTSVVVNEGPPTVAKTGHGAWVRTGRRSYKSHFRVYVFDDTGRRMFTLHVHERIVLSRDGKEYRGKFRTELVFTDGTTAPGVEGTTHAHRITAK